MKIGYIMLEKNIRSLLSRWFSPAAQLQAPAPTPEPEQESQSGPPAEILYDCDHVLRGMNNLKGLQGAIFVFAHEFLDNGKQVFELKGSGQRMLFQDIVLTAPCATTLVLRLHVDAFPTGKNKSREVVTGVEMFKGDDPPIFFDLMSDEQAEVKITVDLFRWMLNTCPQEKKEDLNAFLTELGFIEESSEAEPPAKVSQPAALGIA
jgi:hypothetical protein